MNIDGIEFGKIARYAGMRSSSPGMANKILNGINFVRSDLVYDNLTCFVYVCFSNFFYDVFVFTLYFTSRNIYLNPLAILHASCQINFMTEPNLYEFLAINPVVFLDTFYTFN